MADRVAPGTFVLHSRAVPDLSAGPYVVHTEQSFTAPGATATTCDAHIEVTAPRFLLPADQVLSTFPPNKSQGSFSTRLPQIVLKRRTLPWEREIDPSLAVNGVPSGIPWLALVLLADGECEFLNARPIAQCLTPGVVLAGRSDAPSGNAIVVTQTVVHKVFPTKEELPLLAHVREVDLTDTELAMGDDDGWLAVLLSNRLPQNGVRYRVYLISLEGQYGALLDQAEVEPNPPAAFDSPYVYDTALERLGQRTITKTARSTTVADTWSMTVDRGGYARARGDRPWMLPTKSAGGTGAIHNIGIEEIAPVEPLFTFPVLANWEFMCTDGADFQQLMQQLDVGMLDTVRLPPPGRLGRKPPTPRTLPIPQVVETGHISLSHINRAGEAETVWYRGPLVPHPGGREMPDGFGVLPLLHSSDQARRIGPDGRENLSLAAAFEIGRLLALAEPSVVAAFLNWRKEGFEHARRTALVRTDAQLSLDQVRDVVAGFAARVASRILYELGANDAIRFGDIRPPIDGGCPIEGLDNVDLVHLIATGFDLPVGTVLELIDPGAERPGLVDVPVGRGPADLDELAGRADTELTHLHTVLADKVTTLAENAMLGSGTPGGALDALDHLLREGGR